MDTKVVDVPEKGRFEVRVGDRVVGLASYHVDGDHDDPPAHRGRPQHGRPRDRGRRSSPASPTPPGSAGWTVLPYCSFVRHYIQQHPERIDLVAPSDRPHFGLETAAR